MVKKNNYINKLNRGGMGAGMGYAVLALLSVFGLGAMMVGNITPIDKFTEKQPVDLLPEHPEPTKNTLQLYTFPGVTRTPTPTPSNMPQPEERGGSNYGEAPGGNQSPNHGGGQDNGSAI